MGSYPFRKPNRFRKQKKHPKRHSGRNRHHLIPVSRGGTNSDRNLLLIDIEKHEAWHRIFGLRTLSEVISILHRLDRMKKHQTIWRQKVA